MKFLIVVAVFVILLLLVKLRQNQQAKNKLDLSTSTQKIPYLKPTHKHKLHLCLQSLATNQYDLHCRVALSSLVKLPTKPLQRKSTEKIMDFVFTDKKGVVMAIIELDQGNEPIKPSQDWVLKCLQGNQAFMRIKPQKQYDIEVIKNRLESISEMQFDLPLIEKT